MGKVKTHPFSITLHRILDMCNVHFMEKGLLKTTQGYILIDMRLLLQ